MRIGIPTASNPLCVWNDGEQDACRVPQAARRQVQLVAAAAAACAVVKNASSLPRPELPEKFAIELTLEQTTMAELVSFVPGVARSGETTVHLEVATADELVGFTCAAYYLASVGGQQRLSLLNRR